MVGKGKQTTNSLLVFNPSVYFVWIPPDDAAAAESDESVVDRSYVKKKLEHGLTRIWQVRKNSLLYFSLFAWFEKVSSSSLSTTSFFFQFSIQLTVAQS